MWIFHSQCFLPPTPETTIAWWRDESETNCVSTKKVSFHFHCCYFHFVVFPDEKFTILKILTVNFFFCLLHICFRASKPSAKNIVRILCISAMCWFLSFDLNLWGSVTFRSGRMNTITDEMLLWKTPGCFAKFFSRVSRFTERWTNPDFPLLVYCLLLMSTNKFNSEAEGQQEHGSKW